MFARGKQCTFLLFQKQVYVVDCANDKPGKQLSQLSRLKGVSFGKLDWTSYGAPFVTNFLAVLFEMCFPKFKKVCLKFWHVGLVWEFKPTHSRLWTYVQRFILVFEKSNHVPYFERLFEDSYVCLRSQTTFQTLNVCSKIHMYVWEVKPMFQNLNVHCWSWT